MVVKVFHRHLFWILVYFVLCSNCG